MANTGIYTIKKLDTPNHPNVVNVLEDIKRAAEMLKWEQHTEVKPTTALLLAVGGDGTMIHGMKLSAKYNIPVLGFNLGKLGFLAEYAPTAVLETLALAMKDALRTEYRTMLDCDINGTSFTAVNDLVFSPKYADKMLRYQFDVDGVFSGKHLANGVLISTPTGSTAYALSAGGTILQPEVPAFEIVPIAPISLNARGVIISDNANIVITMYPGENVEYMVTADGQRVHEFTATSKEPITFKVTKAQNRAMVLHHPNWNFFTTLSQKLHWNTPI